MDDKTLIMECEEVDVKIKPGVADKALSMSSLTDMTSPEVPPIVIKPDPSSTSPEEPAFIGHIKIEPEPGLDPGDNKPGVHQESQTPGNSLQVTLGLPDWAFTSFQPRNHETTTHMCAVCSKGYKTKNDLKAHQLVHSIERPHTCDFCGKQFCHVSNLEIHQRIHTGEKPFKCTVCDSAFSTNSNLKKHLVVHSGNRPHKCLSCNLSFKRMQTLTVHQTIHHDSCVEIVNLPLHQEKPAREKLDCYERDNCDEGIKSVNASKLERHGLLHTGEKPNEDYGQPRQTTSVGVAAETGVKLFECAECAEAFYFDSSWGDRPDKCLSCNLSFKQEQKVTVHEKIHHYPGDNSVVNVNTPLHQEKPPGVKPYKHDLCKNEITKYVDSAIQQNAQILHKPFQCTVCDKAFLSASDLKQHQPVHSGKSAYICSLCGLHFRQKQTLIAHHRIHHGSSVEILNKVLQQEKHMFLQQEKPSVGKFPCTVCDQSFSLAGILEAHQLVHSRAKPHTCDVCGKPFCDVSNLETHKLLHTGEKPY